MMFLLCFRPPASADRLARPAPVQQPGAAGLGHSDRGGLPVIPGHEQLGRRGGGEHGPVPALLGPGQRPAAAAGRRGGIQQGPPQDQTHPLQGKDQVKSGIKMLFFSNIHSVVPNT